jgi:hypothetical protein
MRTYNVSLSGMEFSSMNRIDASLAACDGADMMQNSNKFNSAMQKSNNSPNSLSLQFGSLEMGDWFGGETTLRDEGTHFQKCSV